MSMYSMVGTSVLLYVNGWWRKKCVG
jgi:hypothetical protein